MSTPGSFEQPAGVVQAAPAPPLLEPREEWRAETGLYLSADGEHVEGPLVEGEVASLWKHGRIASGVTACWEGEERWWPISDARHHLGFTDKEREQLGVALLFGIGGLFFLFVHWPAALALLAVGGFLFWRLRRARLL